MNTEFLDGNQGHQEETHRPTHRFRRLFLDLLSMGWRGCASASSTLFTFVSQALWQNMVQWNTILIGTNEALCYTRHYMKMTINVGYDPRKEFTKYTRTSAWYGHFLQNIHKRHSVPRPWGCSMACLSWVHNPFCIPHLVPWSYLTWWLRLGMQMNFGEILWKPRVIILPTLSSMLAPQSCITITTPSMTTNMPSWELAVFSVHVRPVGFMVQCMMTSSNGNIFCVTGPLCGEFTGH